MILGGIILWIYCFLVRKIKIQHTKFSSKQLLRQSKKMYETRNFTTTVQIQPSLSYQTEIKHTTLAIPNPKTVFAIASFKKQKNLLEKSGNIGSLVDEKTSQTTAKPSTSAWQRRANRVFRNAALGITVPSTWMMGLQIVLMALPNGDTKSIDIAVVTLLSAFSLGTPYCTRFCLFSA